MKKIIYLKNDKEFKKRLPELIKKYNLKDIPNNLVGRTLLGDGIKITIDNDDVEVSIFRKSIKFDFK